MKLTIDIQGKQFTVTKAPEPKLDQDKRQKTERDTGRPLWSTQMMALDATGGEMITVTTGGEIPNVKVGMLVLPNQLEAIPWVSDKRNGVAFRAVDIRVVAGAGLKAA